MPAYNESLDKIIEFGTKWTSTPGLNLDTEIQDLQTQLQAIWDQEG
jgi:GTP cyclohydrolase III